MSAQTFTLPDLGEGLTEAEIVRWLVSVGDEIVVDQVVVEVETAKSIVEVPSPYAGAVSILHAEEGKTLDVGRPLISVDAGGAPTADDATAAEEQYREEEQAGSGNVLIGYGTSEAPTGRRRRAPRSAVSPVFEPQGSPTTGPQRVPRVTSPLVRRMAREAGLSVATIVGTGPDGLITRRDVQAAIAGSQPVAVVAPDAAPAAPAAQPSVRTGLEIAERVPMSGFRKAVSAALSRSRSEIPEATVWVDVDFTELFAMRELSKARGAAVPGLLAYLARFTVAALKTYPELNGEVDAERNELIRYEGINLGIAVQSDRGLVVPAVQRADRLTTLELDAALRGLTESARQGKSSQTELTSGTFTLNNYGAFNVDGSAAIVNHPQVAILGFGRIIDRPWVVDGQIVVRKIGQMSFVFDHRVCDGGVASGFMRQVADAIESPAQAINHL
ncbi:dihydrolipoamide acetyltransferase family protein [Aeromicrobium fastidiosum]|uniref:Dihydrolipoamide acetyltransferase component of pyruvate dehydrogenase complex n=1 Tax=Aeromicrobium fastidiosum TaxID=52699 RepID=A0A641AJW5_9ACTN|nr:dihydrolipoamide acetyltransferase family protein [Aeromicrobium fastidiosum]KAA1373054.1 2-oxo acid dehydrogenase subunit E2 [Aeromicrobium fastidiosum]MBP2391035.1 pyruvate dehydrogenase E2 component (dihydrolipoamide acetyltransferase) [Aeromicrobium fastidiosum]